MKRRLCLALSVLLLVFLLCGCGSSAKGTPSMARNDYASYAPTPAEMPMADNSGGWKTEAYDSAGATTEAKAASITANQPAGAGLPENVKLIYRANIEMESTEFDAALEGLNALVSRMGGYFENSNLNNYSRYRQGYYTVRLPSENFDAFCAAAGDLCQINSLSRSAEDISERYYDTESRLVTQQTKLARLQELLKQAEDMEDIITLESAISETELAIENLTGTLRRYDSLVGYATVDISLTEVYKLSEVEEPAIGFGAKLAAAFRAGASRFVNGCQSFLLGVARDWIGWLLFLVIVVVVVIVVLRIRRRRRAARQASPRTAPEAPRPPQAPEQ